MGAGNLAGGVTEVSRNGPPFVAIVGGVLFSWRIFRKNDEVVSRDWKSSETCNVFDFGYFGVSNTLYFNHFASPASPIRLVMAQTSRR